MLFVGIRQAFPEYRIRTSSFDSVIDMSSGVIFILPLFLFSLSLAAKLFKSANLFPVNHWGFLVGYTASVSSALLVTLIAVTERVDAFWINIPILLVWLFLMYVSSIGQRFLERIRKCVYGLLVTSLLVMAFLFPFIFGVRYEMTSSVGLGILKELKELNFPDNDHCFRTTIDAKANTLGYVLRAYEEFDTDCSAMDAAKFIIDSGVRSNDVFLTVWGLETLKIISSTHREAAEQLEEVLRNAVTLHGKACFEDENYTVCSKK